MEIAFVRKLISIHYISWHSMHLLPIWYNATNSAYWLCWCHIITNTCHLITCTCCSPNEMVVWWQHRLLLRGFSHSGGFSFILRCPGHLGSLSLQLTLTLELNPLIFSFFMSNKCVRHLVAEWLAVRDLYLLSWTVPTASHLSCLIHSKPCGCTVTLLTSQVGRSEDIVSLEEFKTEFQKW